MSHSRPARMALLLVLMAVSAGAGAQDEARLSELLERARSRAVEEAEVAWAATFLRDEDPFVRAMAEWVVSEKVDRDNAGQELLWPRSEALEWFHEWASLPAEARLEADYARQGLVWGIHLSADRLLSSARKVLQRAEKAAKRSGCVERVDALRSRVAAMEAASRTPLCLRSLRRQWIDLRRAARPIVLSHPSLDFTEFPPPRAPEGPAQPRGTISAARDRPSENSPGEPVAAEEGRSGPSAESTTPDFPYVRDDEGWLDLQSLLVPSDGSRSLGDHRARFNKSRDRGSKIVFFDPVAGDNESADVYWWDGKRIVDSAGREASPRNGKAYGVDPLLPDEEAIQPFRHGVGMVRNADADPRLRTNDRDCSAVAGGYPDWFLYRRGRTHDTFDSSIVGGRSEREPMVVAAYGPHEDGRAIIAPALGKQVQFRDRERNVRNPFSGGTKGAETVWWHMVYSGLDVRAPWTGLGSHVADSLSGGPVTAYAEDCRWSHGEGGRLVYLPRKTRIHRSVVAFCWREQSHNQGYFNSGFRASTTFDEVIFYRNGYKGDPRTHADPRRDIFSRNIYQGGGGRMGHRYLGIISADGGSGGPQMRLGGTIERSLIIEGYWYSSTNSNKLVNPWLISSGQSGQSAVVRNNVQLVFDFPSPRDPDTAARKSSTAAQPGWGYALSSASFGALVEGNVISRAMLIDDLGAEEGTGGHGIAISTRPEEYEDGRRYSQQNNTIRGNIVYRMGSGLQLQGDWSDARGIVVENNVFVADRALNHRAGTIDGREVLHVRGNRFYVEEGLPEGRAWASDNTVAAYEEAAEAEGWPDPDRTLRRYVTEVLGLKLLEWGDDPWLDPETRESRVHAGESYDPTGLKTFMAVATNMRRGGTEPVPGTGKPSWTGDYRWDERLTGPAVVRWIRAGFGLPASD